MQRTASPFSRAVPTPATRTAPDEAGQRLVELRARHRQLSELAIRLAAEEHHLHQQRDEAVRQAEALVGTGDVDEIERIIAQRDADAASQVAEFEAKLAQVEASLAKVSEDAP